MDPRQVFGIVRILEIGCCVAVAIKFRSSGAAKLGGLAAALLLLSVLLVSLSVRMGWMAIWPIINFIKIAAYGCLLASIITAPVSRASLQPAAKATRALKKVTPPAGLKILGLEAKTPDAKFVALGGMLGTLQLTAQASQLEQIDREAVSDAYNVVRRYADQLELTKELDGDYDRIHEVIERTRPERDKGLFETGELTVAFAYPDNRPSLEDLRV